MAATPAMLPISGHHVPIAPVQGVVGPRCVRRFTSRVVESGVVEWWPRAGGPAVLDVSDSVVQERHGHCVIGVHMVIVHCEGRGPAKCRLILPGPAVAGRHLFIVVDCPSCAQLEVVVPGPGAQRLRATPSTTGGEQVVLHLLGVSGTAWCFVSTTQDIIEEDSGEQHKQEPTATAPPCLADASKS